MSGSLRSGSRARGFAGSGELCTVPPDLLHASKYHSQREDGSCAKGARAESLRLPCRWLCCRRPRPVRPRRAVVLSCRSKKRSGSRAAAISCTESSARRQPDGPQPAIALITGAINSTSSEQDGAYASAHVTHARRLAPQGFAQFRFDPVGVGQSEGDGTFRNLDTRETEAISAVSFVQSHALIDAVRV